jgi:ElaB/YqjD/DUF883 family membrane-anchored ribosome-binding protein
MDELKAQYEALIKKIDIIQETMDRRFEEWSEDRKSITDLEIRLKTIEAKLEGARDDIAAQTRKVINRVDEHLEPVPQMMGVAVKEELNKRSMVEKLKEAVKK